MTDPIQPYLDEATRRGHEIAEAMVERMLVMPGDWGALVTFEYSVDGVRISGELTHDVPPMTIAFRHVSGASLS